jgi:5'-deoxynucleotidase YfbR-like HD superfamily hydrolase
MRANETLLELLLELQLLDRIPRAGFVLRGVAEPESVTEHSWHVLFLVWVLGRQIEGLDLGRAIEIALVHDLAELRIGDLPRTASRYLPAGAKQSAEAAALADVIAPVGEPARRLLHEYQQGATLEARLVKACDKLQLMFKVAAYEAWGTGALGEFWDNPDNFPGADIPVVKDLFDQLLERRHRSRSRGV